MYSLPSYGVIYNRNLKFPSSQQNPTNSYVSVHNIIDPGFCQGLQCKKSGTRSSTKFGQSYPNYWYPQLAIDTNYNKKLGGYVNANGPIGPYFAVGLQNYPRSVYQEMYFGAPSKKTAKTAKTGKTAKTKSKKK